MQKYYFMYINQVLKIILKFLFRTMFTDFGWAGKTETVTVVVDGKEFYQNKRNVTTAM